ncbi:MAG: hypothetical protein A3I77_06105 [Gammaproteobacteria bacterium RIFCSPLOWO2_02_FULL_42_14]|nr:MAG: hypothetical protein A3B71_06695 [Gammaproteobacteria bacterium RIFCSPHIGHO2_02_FULL_42_43]OGT27714.1 MAG: hypothetical protein A2624_01810 [Gammaproteobacteria bacterium RIFCSPHIGHO2_01_FULL_42_8]OGT52569.1 MAG: hypothetical protein A3E54_06300 [Gammaproteobacteria bacterium RIFCSPHIGHO2_12_FULL_41_25]OGT63167.1 MAG: hypothetical protein A3I77_06105 [Gammaproteobacteria bacterium RIFCSPLOWO2_02_FULL_42_14]OGT86667.1 MAG: hypothetical protein A3G86_04925 [Gammaproteobacteria bacterium R
MKTLKFANTSNESKLLSKQMKTGKLRRVCRGVYTNDLVSPIERIVLTHWMDVVIHVVPGGILSFQTALTLKPIPFQQSHIVFLTSTYHKKIFLPGLIIQVIRADNKRYTEQVLPQLARSSPARFLLENLTTVNAVYQNIKTIGVAGVENYLAKELQLRGEKNINTLRNTAKKIAEVLHFQSAYRKLNDIVSALLLSHPDKNFLKSTYAISVAKKEVCDQTRITLFQSFILYLKKCHFKKRPYHYHKTSFKNIAFFESYFSNFIEGTEFLIDEAEEIVFQGKEIDRRHADSHDVLSHFILSNDYFDMTVTPKSPTEFLQLLQQRHRYLMQGRPEKLPGQFKQKQNKAGNTYFVLPEMVIGTLMQAFSLYKTLQPGMEKALLMHLIVSEVHPFADGNGRMARLMMNAELTQAGLCKIIIPSVQRDNYLNGLRLVSRDHEFRTYTKVMDQCQAYIESVPWMHYAEAREKLEHDAANQPSDDGLPIFNRVLRKLSLSDI